MDEQLIHAAQQLVSCLAAKRIRIVLAESCTGGLVSAALTQIPGVSDWFCGSAVTYRSPTKVSWLDVSPVDLDQFSAVSEPVARQMAVGTLKNTAEADVSAAVTGHLGPNAPGDLDGIIFIAVARRQNDDSMATEVSKHKLRQLSRSARQKEATRLVLVQLVEQLN